MNGLLSDCERLWQEGADINVISRNQNKTPLHAAAENGFHKVVKFLIDKGAKERLYSKKTVLLSPTLQYISVRLIEAGGASDLPQ